ncbi:MAG: PEP-CTERM sorting domain-containing protein [Methyloversatilis discipulorum]|uniref:PEP-CTERM sorting domain-containing protein n=1 Tax=Methyloversatilis discipulorum TaxID=1119528 RepID=UPI0026EDCCF5|nr:PEP-CTERM sorting domain-containing protein [Methyloversatilis discipulorum]MBV5284748.1 PEP-CTERM sorting domain-containing protein [Methyloversatilis discipulorum]
MKLKLAALALAFAAALPAHAALTNNAADIGNPLLVDFEAYDGFFTTGPEEVAPGVIFTGDADSQLGGFIADLGDNGLWGAGNHFAATGFIGELRFTFAELTSGAGALVNYFADNTRPYAVVVSAYGDNNQIIESYTLSVSTDVASLNEGLFLGITRDSADIRSISFKGNSLVVDNLAVAAPVPEPETYAMLLAGLGLIGMAARRRT